MTFLPSIVRRTIIDQWARELESFPESRRAIGTLHVNDRFCALGIFADLCTHHSLRFDWFPQYVVAWGTREKEDVVTTHAIRRLGEPGLDICGLPHEFCWILGFSSEEESRIAGWSDNGLPFADIASHLRTLYVGDDPLMEDIDLAWGLTRASLPDRNRDPDFLEQAGRLSAWGEVAVEPDSDVAVASDVLVG